ncbi:MAG: hypothetical protein WD278_09085 [Pirellulales bacterium]
MRYAKLGLFSLALSASLGVGCEGSPRLVTVPVRGNVTMGGSPVGGAVVVFWNRDAEGKPAMGVTNAQGDFGLSTYINPKETLGGALPGDYDVVITKKEQVPGTPDAQAWWQSFRDQEINVLPVEYSKPGRLEARLNDSADNEFAFNIDVGLDVALPATDK